MTEELGRKGSNDLVAAMVREIDPSWSVETVRRLEEGTDFVARLLLSGPDAPRQAVLKATTAGLVEPTLARPEPDVLSALGNETFVPVPEVYGAIETHPEHPAPYFLMAVNHGQNFEGIGGTMGLTQQRAFLRQSGRILARVHDRWTFSAYGPLGMADGTLEPVETEDGDLHDDFGGWLRNSAEHALEALETDGGYFPDLTEQPERFVDIVEPARTTVENETRSLTVDESPALCHTDYRYGNLLVDYPARRIAAVLDWANLIAGDPLYDLAFAETMMLSPERDGQRVTADLRTSLRRSYAVHSVRSPRKPAARHRMRLYHFVWRLHAMACHPLWYRERTPAERDRRAEEHREAVLRFIDEGSSVEDP